MELEQLRQLVAIDETGTITAAAEATHLTQPSLSRSMRRLEAELGCELFERTRNRAEFNEAGRTAVRHARDVLAAEQRLRDAIGELANRRHAIRVASVAPAPVWNLTARVIERLGGSVIEPELLPEAEVERRLFDRTADLAITRRPFALPNLRCVPLMSESLFLHAPEGHPLAKRKSVSFADLDGEDFLVYAEIGFWEGVYRNAMPNMRAVVQRDREVFAQMIRTSDHLCFTTDAPQNQRDVPGRVRVPITDASAHATFYLVAHVQAPERIAQIVDWVMAG